MDNKKHFADFLKSTRTEKEMTTKELAERSGLSQSYISNLENGTRKTPKIETLNKLALGLGVPNGTMFLAAGLIDTDQDDPFAFKLNKNGDKLIKPNEVDMFNILNYKEEVWFKGKSLNKEQRKLASDVLDALFKNI